MSMNHKLKKEWSDLEKLSPEQIDDIADQIGIKLKTMLDQACEDMNKILLDKNMRACIDHTAFDLKNIPKDLKESLFVNPKCLRSLDKNDIDKLEFILMNVSNRCKIFCRNYQVYPAISYHIVEMPENTKK